MPNIGSGEYVYESLQDWAKVPEGWELVDVSGVAVDANDEVYVLCRGTHPVLVFDANGVLIRYWGTSVCVVD